MAKKELTPPLKIFLCHSNEDKAAARVLYQDLRKDGFDPWLDEEKLMPGQDWDLEIKKAERKSDVIVICISRQSAQKEGYVQKEIKFALDIADEKPDGTIYIIPTRLESCPLPARLSRWHSVDIFTPKGYTKLKNALRSRYDEINSIKNYSLMPKKENAQDGSLRNDETKLLLTTNMSSTNKIINQLPAFLIFPFILFLNIYFVSKTLSAMGYEIEFLSFFTQFDFRNAILISNILSQIVSLFVIFETYGITKLTGFRYLSSQLKYFRTIAFILIFTTTISWAGISLKGLEVIETASIFSMQDKDIVYSVSAYLIPVINMILAAQLIMNESL